MVATGEPINVLLGPFCHSRDQEPSACDLPPPYAIQLEYTPPNDRLNTYFVPEEISVELDKSRINSGDVISGQFLLSPRVTLVDPILLFEINCLEQARDEGTLISKDKVSIRKRTIAKSTLPLEGSIAPGQHSRIPFALKMPTDCTEILCDCPSLSAGARDVCINHFAYPPSVGYTGDVRESFMNFVAQYMVRVRVSGSSLKAQKPFWYTPTVSMMEIGGFQNAKGESLDRVVTVTERLTKRKLLTLGPVVGFLGAQFSPIYQSMNITRSGMVPVSLEFAPDEHLSGTEHEPVFAIQDVKGSIVKRWYSSTRGIGTVLDKTESTKTIDYKVPTTELVKDYNLIPKTMVNQWVLKVWYTIPESTMLNIPSFASCFGALTYEIELKIKHSFGVTKLSVPLVLQIGGLPSYCSLNTTSTVPSAPSLISDS